MHTRLYMTHGSIFSIFVLHYQLQARTSTARLSMELSTIFVIRIVCWKFLSGRLHSSNAGPHNVVMAPSPPFLPVYGNETNNQTRWYGMDSPPSHFAHQIKQTIFPLPFISMQRYCHAETLNSVFGRCVCVARTHSQLTYKYKSIWVCCVPRVWRRPHTKHSNTQRRRWRVVGRINTLVCQTTCLNSDSNVMVTFITLHNAATCIAYGVAARWPKHVGSVFVRAIWRESHKLHAHSSHQRRTGEKKNESGTRKHSGRQT